MEISKWKPAAVLFMSYIYDCLTAVGQKHLCCSANIPEVKKDDHYLKVVSATTWAKSCPLQTEWHRKNRCASWYYIHCFMAWSAYSNVMIFSHFTLLLNYMQLVSRSIPYFHTWCNCSYSPATEGLPSKCKVKTTQDFAKLKITPNNTGERKWASLTYKDKEKA